jgi:hypothetical protein
MTDMELTQNLGDCMFNEKKAAQVAKYILYVLDRPLEKEKLLQLMYLAERETILKNEDNFNALTEDSPITMAQGMGLRRIYNLIEGICEQLGHWAKYITLDDDDMVVQVSNIIKEEDESIAKRIMGC